MATGGSTAWRARREWPHCSCNGGLLGAGADIVTRVMAASPLAALDLPLKMLAWADGGLGWQPRWVRGGVIGPASPRV